MTSARYGSVPFKEQIEFFRQKVNIPTSSWVDVYAEQHDVGFMVAGARGRVLEDFRSVLDKVVSEGMTFEQFQSNFDDIVARTGWAYNGGRNWRTRVIYETNLRQSYNAGREAQMADPEFRKLRPYGLYRHGGSTEPRPDHLAWDGLVLPLDDPWWETHTPQNGWGCKCKKYTISAEEAESYGYTVAEQAPEIEWEERTIGQRSGNPHTVRVPKGIDPGFEYRPGALQGRIQSQTPRELGELPLLPAQVRSGTLPPLPTPRPVTSDPFDVDGLEDGEIMQLFFNALGAQGKQTFIYKDVTGERIPISSKLFERPRGGSKLRKNNRHKHLHLLAETISDPDEIWLRWHDKGAIRRRYIRYLPESSGLAIFELGKDGWSETTTFQITKETLETNKFDTVEDYLNAQRAGLRIYQREK